MYLKAISKRAFGILAFQVVDTFRSVKCFLSFAYANFQSVSRLQC